MSDGVGFDIKGLEELRGKLAEISTDLQKRGGRTAMRKAAQLVRDAARANAQSVDDPATKESIAKNIVERWNGRLNRLSGGNDIGFRIGVLGGARAPAIASGEFRGGGKANPGGDTFYWRFIEFGKQKMSAQPFLRSALEQNSGAATDTFIREYDKALDRAIRRAGKKQ